MYIRDIKRIEEKLPRICENLSLPASWIERAYVAMDYSRRAAPAPIDESCYRVDLGILEDGVNLYFRQDNRRLVRVVVLSAVYGGHDSNDDPAFLAKAKEGVE